jgi:hypothetical protein
MAEISHLKGIINTTDSRQGRWRREQENDVENMSSSLQLTFFHSISLRNT